MIRKHFFTWIFLAGFLLASVNFLFAQAQEDEFTPFYAGATTQKVNIRAGQSPNFEILAQAGPEDLLLVTGEKYGWYKVQLPRQALSFVHQDYIANEQVTADKLRIRAGAGTNFNVLGILRKGQRVNTLEEQGDWLRITPPEGSFGWVKKDYLKASKKKFIPGEFTALALKEQENSIKASGVIKRTNRFLKQPTKYRLIKNKKTTYYLRSNDVNLKEYVLKEALVTGVLEQEKNAKYPIINVQELELEQ